VSSKEKEMTFRDINKKCSCLAKKIQQCKRSEKCSKHHGPLSETCKLGKLKICKLTGDRRECAKMAALGLLPGQEAELLCARNGSQCLLKIHGGTLSLDQSTSNNIIVESI
jgi:ferrous iron transport protein A